MSAATNYRVTQLATPLDTFSIRLQDSKAHQFAADRTMRRRESHPGYEVGQTLITCRWALVCSKIG